MTNLRYAVAGAPARIRRTGVAAVAVVLAVTGLAACGGEDEKSNQELYCEAGAELESSVNGLVELDLVAEGTNALEAAIAEIQDDLATLVGTGSEAAADELSALEQSLAGLEESIEGLSGSITGDNMSSLVGAVQDVSGSAQDVYATLSDCP